MNREFPRAARALGLFWIAERKTNMDFQIALLLGQDGIVNGAVYGLMALSLVLAFSVTRVIFIPQGEFVGLWRPQAMVMLQAGGTPGHPVAAAGRWPWPCWPWRAGAGRRARA